MQQAKKHDRALKDDSGEETRRWLRGALIALGWLVVWQLASAIVGNSILFAGPIQTVQALFGLVGSLAFWGIVGSSASHIVVGFLLAFALGIALGWLAHRCRVVREVLAPAVQVMKATPLVCFVVLLLLWVGSRRVSSYAVFLVAFPAVYFSALKGFDAPDQGKDEALRVMGVSAPRRFFSLTWPKALSYVLAACQNACGMSWKAGVAAELIGTPPGTMGERIYQSRLLLETQDLFAWTLVVIAFSYAFEKIFLALLARSDRLTRAASVRFWKPAAPGDRERAMAPATLGLDHVTLAFGDATVLHDVTRDFAPGTKTCLADASGRGKTCTLRLLAGMLTPSSGSVRAPGRMGVVFQDTRLIDQMDAQENVLLGCGRMLSRDEVRANLLEVLPADALDRPVRELSGGQRRRVELVRALCVPAGAVLLDEAFSSLDSASRKAAVSYVLGHLQGRTIVMSSHQKEDACLMGAEVVLIAS